MAADQSELTQRAVAGDRDALTELLQQVGPTVRQNLASRISDKHRSVLDIDDVMQVSYMEAFLRIASFEARGPGAFQAWLNHVARNNLRDAVRELERAKRMPAGQRVFVGEAASSAALLDELGWTTTTPSRHATQRELTESLQEAIRKLPPDYARVLQRYDLEGRQAEEVAAELGRSVGAVYMLRARALDCLREFMGEPDTSA